MWMVWQVSGEPRPLPEEAKKKLAWGRPTGSRSVWGAPPLIGKQFVLLTGPPLTPCSSSSPLVRVWDKGPILPLHVQESQPMV